MQIIYLKSGRRSEGDVKVLKSGKRFVRKKVRVYDGAGKCIGVEATRHGICFEWIEETPCLVKSGINRVLHD